MSGADQGTQALFEALDAMSDGYALFDTTDRLVFCTRKYHEIYQDLADLFTPGTPFEAIVRASVERGTVRLNGMAPGDWIMRRVAEHQAGVGPTEHQLADGRWVRATDYRTNGGYLVTRRTDITREKRARLSLSESEERLSDFAASASDFFWEMDDQLRFSYFSERFTEVTGVPTDRLLGKTRQESGVEGSIDAEVYRRNLADLAAHRPFRNFVHPRTHPDGRVVWLSISGVPVFDGFGVFRGYRGTGRDITEMVEAQDRLRRERNIFTGAMESMSDGFALFDPEDRLIFCNSSFKAQNPELARVIRSGMTFEEMLRDNLKHGRILDAVGREEEFLRGRLAAHREPRGDGVLSPRHDGRWLLLREQRMPDGSTFLVNTDMTALKQREEALQAAKERAEEANRAKSDFLANMSHELRTPLNAIIGFSEMLVRGGDAIVAPKKVEYAENILEAGHHLLNLINDILDMSKIEAGEYALNPELVDVSHLLGSMVELMWPRAEAGCLTIRAEPEPDLPLLWADERAVRQMLLNLLSNAVKFTREGGLVTIRAYRDAGGLAVAVSDNGQGMSEELVEIAAEPFVQGEAGRRYGAHGTGLGLAITRRLIEMHGGRLAIESREGVGTNVLVHFPQSAVVTP